jgi:hypothetical protein
LFSLRRSYDGRDLSRAAQFLAYSRRLKRDYAPKTGAAWMALTKMTRAIFARWLPETSGLLRLLLS